jgi:mono/diheme cytochrome c family protein
MTDSSTSSHGTTDGLWRWLLGGLAGGGIILGLLIAAYAIGYHRGQHHARAAAPAPPTTTAAATTTTPATTTTATATPPSSTTRPVAVTAALVARGKSLYTSDSCSSCHSLSGSPGAGPSFKGLAGSSVTLSDGTTVTADDAYLEQSITAPDAQIVKGYQPGIMPAAISSHGLAGKPDDVRALVAFIKSQH